jgi:DNA-binding NarL/FixJ family response regulator
VAQAEQVLLADPSGGLRLHPPRAKATGADPTTREGRRLVSPGELSARDLSVLRLLADGSSTADIAFGLAYSESTIKNVVHDLVHRLGARNRTHAVAMAIRAGVI